MEGDTERLTSPVQEVGGRKVLYSLDLENKCRALTKAICKLILILGCDATRKWSKTRLLSEIDTNQRTVQKDSAHPAGIVPLARHQLEQLELDLVTYIFSFLRLHAPDFFHPGGNLESLACMPEQL